MARSHGFPQRAVLPLPLPQKGQRHAQVPVHRHPSEVGGVKSAFSSGKEHHRKLQPLAAVNRHDPHRIASGAGSDGHLPAGVAVLPNPIQHLQKLIEVSTSSLVKFPGHMLEAAVEEKGYPWFREYRSKGPANSPLIRATSRSTPYTAA